jgi:hypothetical protein
MSGERTKQILAALSQQLCWIDRASFRYTLYIVAAPWWMIIYGQQKVIAYES